VDDKVVSLFISGELQKGSGFSVIDNIDHIFAEPFGIGGGGSVSLVCTGLEIVLRVGASDCHAATDIAGVSRTIASTSSGVQAPRGALGSGIR
jgi:hypothetical protein